jgi:hypothetical protein
MSKIERICTSPPCQIHGTDCTEDDYVLHASAMRCIETIFARAKETMEVLDLAHLANIGPEPIRIRLELQPKAKDTTIDWKLAATATTNKNHAIVVEIQCIRRAAVTLIEKMREKATETNYALISGETERERGAMDLKLRLTIDAPSAAKTEISVNDSVYRDECNYLLASELLDAAKLVKNGSVWNLINAPIEIGICVTPPPMGHDDWQMDEGFWDPWEADDIEAENSSVYAIPDNVHRFRPSTPPGQDPPPDTYLRR